MNSSKLAFYYEGKLEKANWVIQDRNQGKEVSWSRWRFDDGKNQNWHGILVVSDLPGKEL